MRILYALTAPQMSVLLNGHVAFLVSHGHQVLVCMPGTEETENIALTNQSARIINCPLERDISLTKDLRSLMKMCAVFADVRPDAVVTIGPKAGLLGGLAGFLCGVPLRIQTKWGLRLETTVGVLRFILSMAEKLSAALSHRTFFDGESTRQKAIELGLVSAEKAVLIANGSANGIDHQRFAPLIPHSGKRRLLRIAGIENGDKVVGFVGRINKDKGLIELVEIWLLVLARFPRAKLVVVGQSECKTREEKSAFSELKGLPGVVLTGRQSSVEEIMPELDVLLLPSHREGFSVVVLEAAACETPTVGFDVTGVRDSVVHGRTGMLAKFGDCQAMAEHVIAYLENPSLKRAHGQAGRERVINDFSQEFVWNSYHENYLQLAAERGIG